MNTIILISIAGLFLLLLIINKIKDTPDDNNLIANAKSRADNRQIVTDPIPATGIVAATASATILVNVPPEQDEYVVDSVIAGLQTVLAELIEDIDFELAASWSATRD